MDRRKILLLIFDGLGDRPIAELGRQTPLQAARKEHLDGLDLGGGVRVLFRAGTEHRAALVLRGPGLSPHVSDPDPHDEGAKVLPAKATEPDGAATAKAVNAFMEKSHKILASHPVNVD